jgi:restriction system protein
VPKLGLTIEEVEDLAREQIQAILEAINPYGFQDLVADLLIAMGYYIYWVAPPEKMAGLILLRTGIPCLNTIPIIFN